MSDEFKPSNAALPVSSLRFDNSTLNILESSKVRKLIGPLIACAQEKQVRRIALLSWDNEEQTRVAGQIVAVAFSQQLEQKCALVISEGIRFTCEAFDSFNLIRLPSVENPHGDGHGKNDDFVQEMNRTYPFQIIAGPALNSWSRYTSGSSWHSENGLARNADGHILLVPEAGLSRQVMKRIEKFTQEQKIKWMGIIAVGTPS